VELTNFSPVSASFNRDFGSKENPLDEETVNALLLGPLIKPKAERLKKMVKKIEDRGYAKGRTLA